MPCILAAVFIIELLGSHPEMRETTFVGAELDAALQLLSVPDALYDAQSLAVFYIPHSDGPGRIEFFDGDGCRMRMGGPMPSSDIEELIAAVRGIIPA